MSERINVLVFYSHQHSYIGAIADYLNAFKNHSKCNIIYHDPHLSKIDLGPFDALILNYCIVTELHRLPKTFLQKIRNFRGPKIAIVQDEYDNALKQRNFLISLDIDCIVTTIPNSEDYAKVYYGAEFADVDFIQAFTGYTTNEMMNPPKPISFKDRKWFIGYRGRQLPFRYGRLGWEKFYIGKRMQEICKERNVSSNIAMDEASRIYADEWPEFIRNCRVTLGTESGSNLFDIDGTILPAMNKYLKAHPDADFETVHQKFLKDHDGKIRMNQISPKIFEAIALKTALLVFEGEYSGVLKAWEHCIPLKKNFSNIDEVLEAVDNIPLLEKMTTRAYDDIIASGKYSYASFISRVDDYIEHNVKSKSNMTPIYMLAGWRDSNGNAEFFRDIRMKYLTDEILLAKDPLPADPVIELKKKIVKYLMKYKFLHRDHASGSWIWLNRFRR